MRALPDYMIGFKKLAQRLGNALGGINESYERKLLLAEEISKAYEDMGNLVFEAGVSYTIGDDYTAPLSIWDFNDYGFNSPEKVGAYEKWLEGQSNPLSWPLRSAATTKMAFDYLGQAGKYKELVSSPDLHKVSIQRLEQVLEKLPLNY